MCVGVMCFYLMSTHAVVAVLKKNFRGLCRCLPRDHMVTIERLKRRATVGDQLQYDLNNLPSIEERNEMILAIMIKPLENDVEVLQFCDTIEDVIDEDSKASKKCIQNVRSGMDTVIYANIIYCLTCNVYCL